MVSSTQSSLYNNDTFAILKHLRYLLLVYRWLQGWNESYSSEPRNAHAISGQIAVKVSPRRKRVWADCPRLFTHPSGDTELRRGNQWIESCQGSSVATVFGVIQYYIIFLLSVTELAISTHTGARYSGIGLLLKHRWINLQLIFNSSKITGLIISWDYGIFYFVVPRNWKKVVSRLDLGFPAPIGHSRGWRWL